MSLFVKRLFHNSCIKMAKRALLVLAEGAEEMEVVITVDVLRRGNVDVTVAGLVNTEPVKCSRQVVIVPDVSLNDALKSGVYDAVILPGGLQGAHSLADSSVVGKLLKEQEQSGRIVAAICAAPLAFKSHQIANQKTITSHPSVKDQIVAAGCYTYSEERVVHDGNCVTSRGPGTAFEFGLKLVEILQGNEKKSEIIPPMLVKL